MFPASEGRSVAGAPPHQHTACAYLLRAAQAGEPAAMDQLLEEIRRIAYRASLSMGSRNGTADDVAQEVLVRTFRHAKDVREPNAFGVWLHRTIRNTHLMQHRRRAHEPAAFEPIAASRLPWSDGGDPVEPSLDPEARAMLADARRHLIAALHALPLPYRAVLVLRDVAGLSTREASNALGISEPAVKTRLRRAHIRARRLLGDGLAG